MFNRIFETARGTDEPKEWRVARDGFERLGLDYEVKDDQLVSRIASGGEVHFTLHLVIQERFVQCLFIRVAPLTAQEARGPLCQSLLELNQNLVWGSFRLLNIDGRLHLTCGSTIDTHLMNGGYVAAVSKQLVESMRSVVNALK